MALYGGRGPHRKLPPDQIAAITRRLAAGERAPALAREYGVAVRTIWRYRDDPAGLLRRRFVRALDTWPSAHLLDAAQREDLAAWLAEVADRWVD